MNRKKTIILALVACTLWASAFPTLKVLYNLLDLSDGVGVKLQLAGIRFTLAGVVILIYYFIRNKKMPVLPKGRVRLQVALLGLTQTAIMYTFFYLGVYNTTGVKSSIISQTGTFLVVLLAHFVYHDDRMHKGKWIGLMLGLLGIVVVNINGFNDMSTFFVFKISGEGFIIMSGVFSAISTFFVKYMGKKVNPVLLTGWQILIGGVILLVVGLIVAGEVVVFTSISSIALLLYSVLISSGAFTLWFVLLQKNKAAELSMIKFSIPVLGAIFSALVIPGEKLTIYIIVALMLVAFGIYQCYSPKHQKSA